MNVPIDPDATGFGSASSLQASLPVESTARRKQQGAHSGASAPVPPVIRFGFGRSVLEGTQKFNRSDRPLQRSSDMTEPADTLLAGNCELHG